MKRIKEYLLYEPIPKEPNSSSRRVFFWPFLSAFSHKKKQSKLKGISKGQKYGKTYSRDTSEEGGNSDKKIKDIWYITKRSEVPYFPIYNKNMKKITYIKDVRIFILPNNNAEKLLPNR